MTTRSARSRLAAVLGVLLVPLIVAGGLLSATWNAGDRLDRVRAAIVNNDEPITIDDQLVPLGRQLSGGLVRGQADTPNLTWVLTDAKKAEDGLRNGSYAAVVTIPKDFSAAATSARDAATARQATIHVQTSSDSAAADPLIAAAVTQVATDVLNRTLTETSLDAIYVGFNEIGDGFQQSADGADQLADGSQQLSVGVERATSGTWTLADGMGQLAAGGRQLAAGSGQLSSGAGQLAAGTSQLAAGTNALPGQVGQLADGSEAYAAGVHQYTAGVTQLSGGVTALAGGLDLLDTQLAASGSMDLSQLDQLTAGAGQLATGANGLDAGLQQYHDGLSQLAVTGLLDPTTGQPYCPPDVAALGADYCAVFTAGTQAGLQAAAAGLTQPGPVDPVTGQPGPSLLQGSAGLAAGADQLNSGVATLTAALSQLPAQQAALSTAVSQLSAGADQLAAGGTQLSAAAPQLTDGADQLAGGTRQLATGLVALSQGISQLDQGTQQFAQGVRQFDAGVGQYADGVSQAATGTQALADGMTQLEDGTRQIADGNRQLADGLAEGAAQAPHYDAAERDRLATVMTRPVKSADPELSGPFITAPALLLVVALWLGGLATFVALRSVAPGALTDSGSSVRLAIRSMAPGAAIGAAQGAAIAAIGQWYLRLPTDELLPCAAVLVLAGVTFAALNQALVGWLGGTGRVVSVALAVLGAAGALLSATPPLFEALRPVLPTTPALDALRLILSDQPGVPAAVVGLACWWFIGAVAVLLRVVRSRIVSADRLVAELA